MKMDPPFEFRFTMNNHIVYAKLLEISDQPGNVWFKIQLSNGLVDVYKLANGDWSGEKDESNEYIQSLKGSLQMLLFLNNKHYQWKESIAGRELTVWAFRNPVKKDKMHFFFDGKIQFDAYRKSGIWKAVSGHNVPNELVEHLLFQFNAVNKR